MKIIHIGCRLSNAERETILNYDCEYKKWYMCTMVMKHFNKAKKQGWVQTAEYRYDDETICGGCFEAPSRAITIRSTEKKQMSEKQLQNLPDDDDEE